MKIVNVTETAAFEQFAEKHDFTLLVRERSTDLLVTGLPRYYVSFASSEVKDGNFLRSCYGSGDTVQEAIKDYADRLEGKLLIINAHTAQRCEIPVPTKLTYQLHESAADEPNKP